MKRVIYNTCVTDPWLDVAKKLYEEESFEPIYWIGYSYDHSRIEIPEVFPNITYQSTEDAWKCIFPKEIEEKTPYYYVDIDFLREIASNELQAINMMNRLDFSSYDFNYLERERHFIKLMKSWLAVIDVYKPDMVISAVFPHRVYDYVLYLLCKKMSIPFLMFQYSMTSGRIYCLDDFTSMYNMLSKDYDKFMLKDITWGDIPSEIRLARERVTKDNYIKAEPQYMKNNKDLDKKFSSTYGKVKRYIQRRHDKGDKLRWKNYNSCFKNKGVLFEENYQTLLGYFLAFNKAKRQKKELAGIYSSLTTKCSLAEKYIYFPLHYQPENTTSPAGDIYANQTLCIENVLKHTPESVYIYIKEHPAQFMSQFLGQTSRIKEFYLDLVKNKRIRLVPLGEDPYMLMKNSIAVMTVTGTVGWEAICNKKPVIIFGSVWYEKYNGVLRITDEKSSENIWPFIDRFKYEENNLLAYLMAFAKNSIRAYHYAGYKETANVSHDESVTNITNCILSKVSIIE